MLAGFFICLKPFTHIPFLRIFLPFGAGIIASAGFGLTEVSPWILSFLLAPALFLVLRNDISPLARRLSIIVTDLFLFCFALSLVSVAKITQRENFIGRYVKQDSTLTIIAQINDLPVEKANFTKCNLKVMAVRKNDECVPAEGIVLGYFRPSHLSPELLPGNVYQIRCRLIEFSGPANPFEFDYRSYMANRQVYHLAFIDSSAFQKTSIEPGSKLWLLGLSIKQNIISGLRESGLSREACAISEALLTGYTYDIETTVTNAFAHSGTLHVLSVSGLHTGLIYLVLSFLFDLVDRNKRYKVTKFLFITVCLWLFALVTGFSAPVLRAVIMFNLLGAGNIFFRNTASNRINILFVSSFILLCYDPFLLFDIGFQLSYSAMLGIFLFQPFLQNFWHPRSKPAEWTWQSITLSLAATITTLPFTLYYFKQFPAWFFICNLVVVPATFILLLLAVLVIVKVPLTVFFVNSITTFLLWFINLFNTESVGYIDNIDFRAVDSIFLSALILIGSLAVYYRSFRYSVAVLLLLIAWQLNGIFLSAFAKHQTLFSIYHVKNKSIYSLKNTTSVWLNNKDTVNYNYHVRPHMVSFNYPQVEENDFNYVAGSKNRILVLNHRDSWPDIDRSEIKTLVISNNFRLKEPDLLHFKNLELLVADGSNNNRTLDNLSQLCRRIGIRFYCTREKGACVVEL